MDLLGEDSSLTSPSRSDFGSSASRGVVALLLVGSWALDTIMAAAASCAAAPDSVALPAMAAATPPLLTASASPQRLDT